MFYLGANGEKWRKAGPLEDKDGNCCVLGAFRKVCPDPVERADAANVFRAAICDYGVPIVYEWADAPERTWPEVKAMFEKAIALPESQWRF